MAYPKPDSPGHCGNTLGTAIDLVAATVILKPEFSVATERDAEVTPDCADCDKADAAVCVDETEAAEETGARKETARFSSLAPQTTFVIVGP